jgi:glycolate oxidase
MTSILEIDEDAMTATVQPGVLNAALAGAAKDVRLWYPPDPASWEFSTIGGNVATNAGGLCCLKYGVTRDSVLELEVVLADGVARRIGHRTRKAVVGYDLVSLMCGSEGTLGVITEVTVRLQPPQKPACTLAAAFDSMSAAGDAIVQTVRRTRPSLLELMDATTMAAVEELAPMDLDPAGAAMLFARSDDGVGDSREEIAAIERICLEAGATLAVTSDDEAEGRMLMAARRLAYPALERAGSTLLDDVAVPVPRIPAFLSGVEDIAQRHGVMIGTFGHAGDGNMHPTIVYDKADEDEVRRARDAFAAILRLGLDLGGAISGEHGVGELKRDFLQADLGDTLALHHRVKSAFDPKGLLNPGRAI